MTKRKPRVNVVVSHEQHELLLELASLDPSVRSASAFVRQMLDEVTPLLRSTVPAMRAAAEHMDTSREKLREPLRNFMVAMEQMDLLDVPAPGAARTERSEGARTKRKPRKNP